MENQKYSEEELKRLDLALAIPAAGIGYIAGGVRSWIDPLAIPKEIKHIHEKGINTFTDYTCHIFGSLGYFCGVWNSISKIINDPVDVRNYFPVFTNVIAGAIIFGKKLYDEKKGGLEEKV